MKNLPHKLSWHMACIAGCMALSPAAMSASISTSFTVRLVIQSSCHITATEHDFGRHGNVQRASLHAQNSLHIRCTQGTPYRVNLGSGSGSGSSAAARVMTHAVTGKTVTYSLYRDAARNLAWTATDGVSGVATGLPQVVPIYGSVPAPQAGLDDGTYIDTVVATVDF